MRRAHKLLSPHPHVFSGQIGLNAGFNRGRPTHSPFLASLCLLVATGISGISFGQGEAGNAVAESDSKRGVLVDVELPITSRVVAIVNETLETIAESNPSDAAKITRTTVVLRYRTDQGDGAATQFEDGLKLARTFAKPEFRHLRLVSFIEGDIKGHAALPILGSDAIIVRNQSSIAEAAINEPGEEADSTIVASYLAIAERRGLFPPAVVTSLIQPSQELVLATTLDGKRKFVAGEEIATLRREGGGWQEEIWSAPEQPLILTAARLRSSRIASHGVESMEEIPQLLDLSSLEPIADQLIGKELATGLLEVSGAISTDRVRRWELNLAKATDAGELNTVMVSIDSSGGSLGASVMLAGTLSSTQPPLKRAIGYVQNQSLGDSALIAVACKPLYLHPDARLGGPGGQAIDANDLRPIEEAIEQIAMDAGRPTALLRGLLDPELKVYRYTNTKTGQIRYATEDELTIGADEPEAERRLWQRGDLISLEKGLNAAEALELGLAEGQATSIDDLATTLGLPSVPTPITDRGLIHFVEWVGGLKGVAILLLLVGLVAMSMEAGAPGISIPGFVALICFSLYFWIQFLNGTAQWLEILAFALGLVCIAIELFIVPGVGVFGIGGLCLLVLGVVLTSQTFVIPRNTYQFEQLTRNLWLVLAGVGSIIVGFALLRILMPQRMILKHLALESPDDEYIDRAERLTDYEHLLGESGVATTPLRPAGKAKFGNDVVQVVSDGTPMNVGDEVRVIDVMGNRVVVAPIE